MRGRVTFAAAGQEYALHYTTNRLCQLEEEAGEGVLALAAKLDEPGMVTFKLLRIIFRAGLVGDVKLAQAGDIIDALGVHQALALVSESMGAAFNVEAADGEAGKTKASAA